MIQNMVFDMSDDNCPDYGAVPAIMWRAGGAFQQCTECICGRVTRWVHCGHDGRASASDAAVNSPE